MNKLTMPETIKVIICLFQSNHVNDYIIGATETIRKVYYHILLIVSNCDCEEYRTSHRCKTDGCLDLNLASNDLTS